MGRRNLLVLLFLAVSVLLMSQPGNEYILASDTDNTRRPAMPAQAWECNHNDVYMPLAPVESSLPNTGLMQSGLANQSEPLISNDPYVHMQWALSKIEASSLPEITARSREVLVAILDTGIDRNHEDLNGQIIAEVNFTASPIPNDSYGHGTHVAGIIAAKENDIGIVGIAPECPLLNVKVTDDNGRCQASALAKGIVWAVNNGANVINISVEIREYSPELEEAVNYAWSEGAIIIAAAGNHGSEWPVYPAYHENCIAVAATNQDDNLAPLSNYGDWVDVAAPGFEIYSTLPDNSYGYKSGTSFACAYISGIAALLFDVVSDTNGDGRVNDEVRAAIETGCQEIGIGGIGKGRIDAAKVMAKVYNVSQLCYQSQNK